MKKVKNNQKTKDPLTMEKRKESPFSKDVYLLGSDKEGTYYWLEAPSWDCGWYWGFGYIETFTNNKLGDGSSKDINSHSHANNFISKYFTNWNNSNPILKTRTFNKKEGWELSELFEQFYHLRKQAEFWGRGKMNCADTAIENWQDKDLAKKINKKMLPVIMDRIIGILSPE